MKDIKLSEFKPDSELAVEKHSIDFPCSEVIDFHCHFFTDVDPRKPAYDIEKTIRHIYGYGVAGIVNLIHLSEDSVYRVLEFTKEYRDIFMPFATVDVSGLDEAGFPERTSKVIKDFYKMGVRGLKFLKDVSLKCKDKYGRYIRIDDKRLRPIWETAAELGIPVLIHIADPVAFFKPVDGKNERFEELSLFPDWSFFGEQFFKFDELMDMQENLLSQNPNTTFVIAHAGSYSENLGFVAAQLDAHPNMYIDTAARISELGRQPYTSRAFIMKYQDRILFATDSRYDSDIYPFNYRFFETWDEYFDYEPDPIMGRWKIYGIGLPREVLVKIYAGNALKLVPALGRAVELYKCRG